MIQQIKKVNFANPVHTNRPRIGLIQKIEGKRADILIHAKTCAIEEQEAKKIERVLLTSSESTKRPIRSEYRPMKLQGNQEQESTYPMTRSTSFHSKSRLSKLKQNDEIKCRTSCTYSSEFIHSKSCPMSQSKQKQEGKYRMSPVFSEESVHSESCPMRSQFKRKYQTTRRSSEESIHSKSCPVRVQFKQKKQTRFLTSQEYSKRYIVSKSCLMGQQSKQKNSKRLTSVVSSEESIHSRSCPMRPQSKHKKCKYHMLDVSSEESVHFETCPLRLQSKQKKVKYHTTGVSSEEMIHSKSCPMRPVSKQNKQRQYQISYEHSLPCAMRLPLKQKYINYPDATSEESIHSQSCPMRSMIKQRKQMTYEPSNRFFIESKPYKSRLSRAQKIERKYQRSFARRYPNSRGGSPEAYIKKNCLDSYFIRSDFKRMTRYLKLKHKAIDAMRNRKIFTVKGKNATAVRHALQERGWVEKLPDKEDSENELKVSSIEKREKIILSSFLREYNPNLIWGGKLFKAPDTGIRQCEDPIRNSLKVQEFWNTKAKLCNTLKDKCMENVAEVAAPRTYSNVNNDELREFINDYNLTACTSLLTWILENVEKNQSIFNDTGTISTNIIVFAIKRCKEYLFKKEHLDIDNKICNSITPGQWNFFITKYLSLISGKDLFQIDKDRNMLILIAYAKCLMEKILKYRPQLRCEGCYNIWIIKPSASSSGKGIILSSDLEKMLSIIAKARETFVVQKYIEEPLLIYDTKFDIRQYYLITNTYPLEIWMYKDCFLKFCSQKYSLNSLHESIHLTNQAVQNRYENGSDRHPGLPKNNLCNLFTYKRYLKEIGKERAWDDVIYPGMKKIIIGIMLSNQGLLANSKNRFGFYGCDFILDNEFKPWLIEINNTPDLYPSTKARICHRVVSDIIKVVIDHAQNRHASTGKFECIYRQPITPLLRTNEHSEKALKVNDVTLLPHFFCRENEVKDEMKRGNEVKETKKGEEKKKVTIKLPHIVGRPVGKEMKKRVRRPPDLSMLQKLDSLFELSVIKKTNNDKYLRVYSGNKISSCKTQTDCDPDCDDHLNINSDIRAETQTQLGWVTELDDDDDNLHVKLDKRACIYKTQTRASWTTETDCNGHLDVNLEQRANNTQIKSVWRTEPGDYDHLDVNPNKVTCASKIQMESSHKMDPDCDNHLNVNTRKEAFACIIQTESGWTTDPDCDDYLIVNPDNDEYYDTQTESGWITDPDCDDHLDLTPDKGPCAYEKKTKSSWMTDMDCHENSEISPDKRDCMTQMTSGWRTEPGDDDDLGLKPDKEICAFKIRTELGWMAYPECHDHLILNTEEEAQTESGWITESECDEHLDVNPDKRAYMTQTKSGWRTESDCDDHLDVNSGKAACVYKTRTDSGWMTESDFDGFGYYNLDVNPDKNISAYTTQTEPNEKIVLGDDINLDVIPDKEIIHIEPRPMTKSDYGDNLDVNPETRFCDAKTELD